MNRNRNMNRLGLGMDEGGDGKGDREGDTDRAESKILDFSQVHLLSPLEGQPKIHFRLFMSHIKKFASFLCLGLSQ